MSNIKEKNKKQMCGCHCISLFIRMCLSIFQNHAASNCYSLLNIFGSILNNIDHIQHHMMHSFVNFFHSLGSLFVLLKFYLLPFLEWVTQSVKRPLMGEERLYPVSVSWVFLQSELKLCSVNAHLSVLSSRHYFVCHYYVSLLWLHLTGYDCVINVKN